MHVSQDLGKLQFSWSCVGMRNGDDDSPLQSCTNAREEPIDLLRYSTVETQVNGASVVKFVPRTLNLFHDKIYKFNVQIRESFVGRGCYDTPRTTTESISILIGPKGEDSMPELQMVVCLKFPCKCGAGVDEESKFNPGTKLVLGACVSEPVKTHKWIVKSQSTDVFRSPTGYGSRKQSFVTVMMDAQHISAS